MTHTQLDLFGPSEEAPDTYNSYNVLIYRGRNVVGGWGQGARGLTFAGVLAMAVMKVDAYRATRVEINGQTAWTRLQPASTTVAR